MDEEDSMDEGVEDEILSEDDGEDWGAALPHVNTDDYHGANVPGHDQEKEPEDLGFHPTPQDIALVRSLFPLPPELVTQILDSAEYWALSRVTRPGSTHFRDANVRYLQSPPIQAGEFTHPLRRLVITTDSKDQGWSSYSETHGTREGSWTWFELTLDDGETGDEIVRVEVVRNIHAGQGYVKHRAVIEDERVLKQAKKGDRLSVWVRAMYPGWQNYVRLVKIEAWSAC
jgi:hypothetical protein